MIIVSQDKDVIINFNNVGSIWINNPLDNDNGEFSIEVSADMDECLGYYKTEERAKEVLQELIEYITGIHKRYEMPEE